MTEQRDTAEADAHALQEAKALLREAVLFRRETRPAEIRARYDAARLELITAELASYRRPIRTVAAYLSTAPEPATLQLVAWLAAQDVRVLLPVLSPLPDGTRRATPDWAPYAGPDQLRMGILSILEPTTEPLGAHALSQAELIFVPGLAGNVAGDRLGRGGGWYDRALGHAGAAAESWLLLNDDEVMEVIPTEAWDRPVDVIATPTRLLRTHH